MSFDKEEEKIAKILEPLMIKKPPESLMKDYEQEVLRKAHALRPGIALAWPGVLAISLLLLGALVFFGWLDFLPKNSPVPATVKMTELVQVEEEGRLKKIDQDLFILEMLGEDGGLIEGFESVLTDVEGMQQVSIPL